MRQLMPVPPSNYAAMLYTVCTVCQALNSSCCAGQLASDLVLERAARLRDQGGSALSVACAGDDL